MLLAYQVILELPAAVIFFILYIFSFILWILPSGGKPWTVSLRDIYSFLPRCCDWHSIIHLLVGQPPQLLLQCSGLLLFGINFKKCQLCSLLAAHRGVPISMGCLDSWVPTTGTLKLPSGLYDNALQLCVHWCWLMLALCEGMLAFKFATQDICIIKW